MAPQSKLSYKGPNNREFEISAGSHLFIKEGNESGVYWEWQKISALHEPLQEILLQAEKDLTRIKQLLPDITQNAVK